MFRFGFLQLVKNIKPYSTLSLHETRTSFPALCHVSRNYSKKVTEEDILKEQDTWIALSDNGRMIMCWHPEVPFPYEHTRPLPDLQPELRAEDSEIKLQYRLDDKTRFAPDGPSDKELEKMTYTTKHLWFKKPEKKYRRKNIMRDREGI